MTSNTPSLVKPFSGVVNGSGVATATITQSLHGIAWVVQQIGFSLGLAAPSPEVSALFNGVPFVSTLVMSNSPFSGLTGMAPVAMTAQFSGPPYPLLESGDAILLGVQGATAGDVFTIAAYINEIQSPATAAAQANAAAGGTTAAYIPRPGGTPVTWKR